MNKIDYRFLYFTLLFGFITILLLTQSPQVLAQPASVLLPTTQTFEKSERRYVYDIFYKKIPVGKVTRELDANKQEVQSNTFADLSFAFYHFGGYQRTDSYWDEGSQLFLSKRFVNKSFGFSKDKTKVDFLKSGHQTKVVHNGKSYEFENENEKIIDFNTLAMQISEGLKSGQKEFEFYMQTENKVKHYFFEVVKKEMLKTKFGKLDTYRLKQTHIKKRKLTLWFAPEINYQMVKFHYKFNLLDLNGVLTEHSTNPL